MSGLAWPLQTTHIPGAVAHSPPIRLLRNLTWWLAVMVLLLPASTGLAGDRDVGRWRLHLLAQTQASETSDPVSPGFGIRALHHALSGLAWSLDFEAILGHADLKRNEVRTSQLTWDASVYWALSPLPRFLLAFGGGVRGGLLMWRPLPADMDDDAEPDHHSGVVGPHASIVVTGEPRDFVSFALSVEGGWHLLDTELAYLGDSRDYGGPWLTVSLGLGVGF